MKKPWACRLGFHDWAESEDRWYQHCWRCSEFTDELVPIPWLLRWAFYACGAALLILLAVL